MKISQLIKNWLNNKLKEIFGHLLNKPQTIVLRLIYYYIISTAVEIKCKMNYRWHKS